MTEQLHLEERDRLRDSLRVAMVEVAALRAENANLRAMLERAIDATETTNAAMRRVLKARQ